MESDYDSTTSTENRVQLVITLQQIHYWLVSSQHEKEGWKWVYNTYKDWQLQRPFRQ